MTDPHSHSYSGWSMEWAHAGIRTACSSLITKPKDMGLLAVGSSTTPPGQVCISRGS